MVLFECIALTASAQSHTLPVLHIHTENGQPITSKIVYVKGSYYLTDSIDMRNALGSKDAPLGLEIRGRGNSSWKGAKKPYKIRLVEKQSFFGMPSNKHWVLIGFGDVTIAGMELGRLMGMGWTPHSRPVEVVLNDDYIGLYLLSENNRINKNRVDIYKQPDNNEDESTIPYGWLVEVDNYFGSDQIVFQENTKWNINITYHSPDTLSSKQRSWLLNEFKDINAAIYDTDKEHSTWEEYLDVDAIARFFIVHELMDNPDGFHGSFFLHKDLGDDERWVAGPLWDMNCMNRTKTDYTFRMKAPYGFTPHWIGELIKDEDFCQAIRKAWTEFYPSKTEDWMNYLDSQILPCEQAYACNNERWQNPNYVPLPEKLDHLKKILTANMEWFDNHLPGSAIDGMASVETNNPHVIIYNLQGTLVREAESYQEAVQGLPHGIYILNGKKIFK